MTTGPNRDTEWKKISYSKKLVLNFALTSGCDKSVEIQDYILAQRECETIAVLISKHVQLLGTPE